MAYDFDFQPKDYEKILRNCHFQGDEKEIFDLRRAGRLSNIQIASEMGMSPATLQRRVNKLYQKVTKALLLE